MALLTPDVLGQVSSLTNYNSNLVAIEAGILDIGPLIVSGLVPSIGTGLSVNVTSGVASIGGRVTVGAITISGLTPSVTNYLYVLNTGIGQANTTGTAPANSVRLGTCAAGVATITSVDVTGASGRQAKVYIGKLAAAPVAVTGSRGSGAALVSLLAALVTLGLISDGTSA